jgi:hypothetical protein
MCHCLMCQKRTGSIFGVQARFRREQLTITGNAQRYDRVGDSGGRVTFHFCATCASTVFWELDGLPEFYAVAVGAFADPGFGAPTVSIYGVRRHPWAVMPGLGAEELD